MSNALRLKWWGLVANVFNSTIADRGFQGYHLWCCGWRVNRSKWGQSQHHLIQHSYPKWLNIAVNRIGNCWKVAVEDTMSAGRHEHICRTCRRTTLINMTINCIQVPLEDMRTLFSRLLRSLVLVSFAPRWNHLMLIQPVCLWLTCTDSRITLHKFCPTLFN